MAAALQALGHDFVTAKVVVRLMSQDQNFYARGSFVPLKLISLFTEHMNNTERHKTQCDEYKLLDYLLL